MVPNLPIYKINYHYLKKLINLKPLEFKAKNLLKYIAKSEQQI